MNAGEQRNQPVEDASLPGERLYHLDELGRLLDIPGKRLREWVEAQWIVPLEWRGDVPWFDFEQVAAARNLCRLIDSGISISRLRKGFGQLQQLLPSDQPAVDALALVERGGRMLWRNERQQLVELGGQLHFDFAEAEPPGPLKMPEPRETAADCCALAAEAEDEGRWEDAAEAYRHALRLGGPDATMSFNLGNVLFALGRRAAAVERLWQAVEIDPGMPRAWNNLGVALAALKQFDDARAAFRTALTLEPGNADAHYNLADTLEQIGWTAEAREHWAAYLKYDQKSRWAMYARRRLGDADSEK
jgi:tetratricopeptide (TPR) repeat protein